MNICFLNMPIEYYSPISGGAVATVTMQHARQLLARGHDVTVLTIVDQNPTYDVGRVVPLTARGGGSLVRRGIAKVSQKWNGWDWPQYGPYLRSFSNALKSLRPVPDVVIVHNDMVSPKYIKALLPDAAVVVWLHNEVRTNQTRGSKAFDSVDLFVPVSQYIRNWTASAHNLNDERFRTILNGVDLDAFSPRPGYLDSSTPLRVLYIGRMDPNKGPDIAAKAVASLQQQNVPISFTAAGSVWWHGGDPMTDPFFRGFKAELDVMGATYLGHITRKDVPSVIRAHDVVCVLSRSNEPFGLVALEAMASGCAVIASNRGGLPEACGGAAMLVDPDKPDAVIRSLRTFAAEPAVLRSYKEQSIARAARASWTSAAEALESAIAHG